MHTYRLALRHADTHTCAPRHPDPALLRQWPLLPQDQPKDIQPLQVEYYPPNGTFSLHYFPYYGNKAQVGASLRLQQLLDHLKFSNDWQKENPKYLTSKDEIRHY